MQRICILLLALLWVGAGALRADQTTTMVQQALKDQGFYYGKVDGQKNVDTTAAIRRYQIRNGLQVTGEVEAETLRSLGVGAGSPRAASPRAHLSDDDALGQSAEIPAGPTAARSPSQRPPGQYNGLGARSFPAGVTGVFYGTPYEMAPPDLQRHVIVGAQTLLARFGYYRNGIDGEFGPGTVFALQAFQRRAGLPASGRLSMETLAALGLLPGQHRPGFSPLGRQRLPRRPIYRGQWIPE